MRRPLFRLLLFLLAISLAPPVGAQTHAAEPLPEKELLRNILEDQEFFWTRPFRARQEDWKTWALLVGGTAGLMPIDTPTARALADHEPGGGFAFSRRVGQWSGAGMDFAVAGSFYLFGRTQGDSRARETGLLGAQAVANALIITELFKLAAGRERPTRGGGRELISDGAGKFFQAGRSFPSGHAMQAWALATVVAEEYRHNPWVRYSAFGLAGFVSVARVTAREHFPSDIFVGSVLGYLIGRHVYRAHHRVPSLASRQNRLHWEFGAGVGPLSGRPALRLTLRFGNH
ncbi:MAG: phosphatase PAP2 family protein [Anaerolineales bacterium]